MRLLFNNYEQDTLTNEHVTPNERKEENDFLDAVMATSVMRQAMLFLQNKGIPYTFDNFKSSTTFHYDLL